MENLSYVHPSSFVDEPSKIGAGTKIWHFSHIMAGAVIGKNCNLGQNVFVASQVTIGNNVKIQNNVSLYDGVVLEDEVFCGPSCVFTNIKNPRSHVNRRHLFQVTTVKCGATIGANSTIVCGVTIGRYALIGAGAVVTTDVPDFALMLGVPAKRRGWVSSYGNTLLECNDKGELICPESGERYREDRNGLLELVKGEALCES